MVNSPPPESDRLLTVSEAAKRLRCSSTNLYSLIDSGELPYVLIGAAKGYRIDPRDLETFIDRRRQSKRRGTPPSLPSRPKLKHIKFS